MKEGISFNASLWENHRFQDQWNYDSFFNCKHQYENKKFKCDIKALGSPLILLLYLEFSFNVLKRCFLVTLLKYALHEWCSHDNTIKVYVLLEDFIIDVNNSSLQYFYG